MSLIRINRNPTRSQLVVFGLAWLVVFGAWTAAAAVKGHTDTAWILGGLAAGIPSIGILWPRGIRPLFVGLSDATSPVGWVVSHVILGLLYFLVFTLMGLIMRLVRYDPLKRRFDRAAPTYWLPRDPSRPSSSYFRQF